MVVASRTKVSDSMSRTREERRWWTRPPFSTAICPISLEPLRVLCHPPFCLLANTERPQPCSASDFFDPTVLAAYFVASQRFDHPVSRRALGREEIVSLDEHLVGNDLGEAKRVTAVFDLHQESRDASGPAGVLRLAHFRAEAEQIMQSLFEQRRDRRLSSGSTAAETILPTRTDGNLTIIDDDAPTVEPASDDSASDDFPELPTARLPAQPHQIATSVRPRPTASLVSTMAGLSTRDSEAKTARCSLLADAFERDASGPSTFAASAASRFSPKAVALARARPQLIASVEDRLDGLLDESVHADQRELLPPMTKAEREVVHEMARSCKVATIELEPEPRRCVVLLRTDRSEWPAARLSDVVKLTSPPTPKRSFLPTPACLVSAREARGHHIPEAAPRRVSAQADVWIPAPPTAVAMAPLPWRGRSALLRMAGATDDTFAPTTRYGASATTTAAMAAHTQLRTQIESAGTLVQAQAPLTWGGLRRIIWSSESEETAIQRLRAHGFPPTACRRALTLAGEVDDSTRFAAASEWLLQHCEFVFRKEHGMSCRAHEPEPANPWRLKDEVEHVQERLAAIAEVSVDVDEMNASANATSQHMVQERVLDALDSAMPGTSALLPRDFLERQPKRWRKDQARRGITHQAHEFVSKEGLEAVEALEQP